MNSHVIRSLAGWALNISLSLLCLIFLCFTLLKVLPGSPFDEEIPLSPVIQKSLEKDWGLEKDSFSQAVSYTSALLQGKWGVSMSKPTVQVSDIILRGLRTTIFLNLAAFTLAVTLSLLVTGLILFLSEPAQRKFVTILTGMASLPSFFWAPLLVFIFGDYLGIFPTFDDGTWLAWCLPLFAIVVRPWATLNLVLYETWSASMKSRVLLFARAKGIRKFQIVFSHGLRLSLVTFIQKAGQIFLQVIVGSFVVEILLGINGLANILFKGLSQRDYTVVVGISLTYCIFSIVITQTMEILSRSFDPRWELSHEQ